MGDWIMTAVLTVLFLFLAASTVVGAAVATIPSLRKRFAPILEEAPSEKGEDL